MGKSSLLLLEQWAVSITMSKNPSEYLKENSLGSSRNELDAQRLHRQRFQFTELTINEVISWPKVSSLVCRFWSLPWTNCPDTQLKWKLRYSPIGCACLEPLVTHCSDRQRNRIGLRGYDTVDCRRTFGGVSPIRKESQRRIHCSDSEWSFSTNRISVSRMTTAQMA